MDFPGLVALKRYGDKWLVSDWVIKIQTGNVVKLRHEIELPISVFKKWHLFQKR